jgi:hypothetical protein
MTPTLVLFLLFLCLGALIGMHLERYFAGDVLGSRRTRLALAIACAVLLVVRLTGDRWLW